MVRHLSLRFLLFRLAAQNIGRRRVRALLLGLSVMLVVGVGFASFTGGWALRSGVATSFSRMGADIVVVPMGTLVNITSTLLTVQPTEQELDGGLAKRLRAVPGVGVVAPQRIVRAQAEGRAINLIAFDPLADFTVQPWLRPDQRLSLEKGSVLIGERVTDSSPGDSLTICGRPLHVEARLGGTGVGPFDESYFISFATLDGLVAAWQEICHASGVVPISAKPAGPAATFDAVAAVAQHRHNLLTGPASCLPDLAPGQVSALLLQLAPGASAQQVMFAIGQIPGIKLVTGNAVFTTTRQALSSLFSSMVVFAVLLLLGLLILISLLFSAIVQERHRELGLLRALGARPAQITSVILTEAAAITALGGLFGLGFGVSLVLIFARTFGFYFESIGVPFAWPPIWITALAASFAVAFSAILGIAGAFVPAWRARRLEPYVLIKAEAAP
jgi:putative ABC transport system permease protein